MMKLCLALIALCVSALTAPVAAQTIDMSGFVNTINLGATQDSARRMMEGDSADDPDQMCANNVAGDECRIRNGLAPRKTPNAPASSAKTANSLSFVPSIAVRQRNFSDMIENARAQGGNTSAANMETFLAADGNIIMASAGTMATMGLRTTNVGDAVAFYLIAHWMTAESTLAIPPAAQADAVKRQFSKTIIANNLIPAMTDAKKQALAEEYIIRGMMALGALQGAKDSDDARADNANKAALTLRNLGLDPARFTLGPAGFRPRG